MADPVAALQLAWGRGGGRGAGAQMREVSLAVLRPVVSNIDSSPWGGVQQEGQGGVGWALGVCRVETVNNS